MKNRFVFRLDSCLITRYYFGEKRVRDLSMHSDVVKYQIRLLILISVRFPFYLFFTLMKGLIL
jgi:hypothetical protein